MITEFSIDVDKLKIHLLFLFEGKLMFILAFELRETFALLLTEYSDKIILNLENVEYIDSTGLGTIAHAAQNLNETNGSIVIICQKPQIKKIFQVSGLLMKNIKLYETKENVFEKHEGVS